MKQYCYDIDYNLSLHYVNNNVKVGPCCQAQHRPLQSGIDITQQPRLVELKELNKQGILTSDCSVCTKVESAGGISRRTSQIEFYNNWHGQGLRSLDLHLGNLCNLKCVICDSANSTSWIADAVALGFSADEFVYDKKNQFDIPEIVAHKDLEMVHFWGGEPLIAPAHLDFLNRLSDNEILKNCRLTYNTNATIIPDDEIIQHWTRAKLVELYFSVDDILQRFEYQRTNALWKDLTKNLKWFYNMPTNNHLFYFTVTWSMLNAYYLPELIDWIRTELPANRFGDATKINLNPASGLCELNELTPMAFAALKQKYTNYPELNVILNSICVTETADYKRFFNYTKKLDHIRNSNYKKNHSQWADILGF